jgi:hypothetical protein
MAALASAGGGTLNLAVPSQSRACCAKEDAQWHGSYLSWRVAPSASTGRMCCGCFVSRTVTFPGCRLHKHYWAVVCVPPGARGEKGDRKQARKARRDARRGPEAAPAPLATPEQLQAVNARPIGEQRVWVSIQIHSLDLMCLIDSIMVPEAFWLGLGAFHQVSSLMCTGLLYNRLALM